MTESKANFSKKPVHDEQEVKVEHEHEHEHEHEQEQGLSHVDARGQARMVNVADKPTTQRIACATAVCVMNEITAQAVRDNTLKKGDVLPVARLAGMAAAKRTDELIPLCHSLLLDEVRIEFQWLEPTRLEVRATVQATGRTGVEMEALVAASLAALTVYDMCKASDRSMNIECVQLQSKSGGVRGDFQRHSQVNNP